MHQNTGINKYRINWKQSTLQGGPKNRTVLKNL